jgi:hypothetical protein
MRYRRPVLVIHAAVRIRLSPTAEAPLLASGRASKSRFRKPMLYPAELRGLNDLRDFLRARLQRGYSRLMGYSEAAGYPVSIGLATRASA